MNCHHSPSIPRPHSRTRTAIRSLTGNFDGGTPKSLNPHQADALQSALLAYLKSVNAETLQTLPKPTPNKQRKVEDD